MDQDHLKEAQEIVKPLLSQIADLEESDRLKSAQITTLKLAVEQLKSQALHHKKLYDDEVHKKNIKKATKK
ncbi:hypothetical protein pb186bvf_018309 [Paramecium bursaria]